MLPILSQLEKKDIQNRNSRRTGIF